MGEALNYKDLPVVQRAFELVRETDAFVQTLPHSPQGKVVADQLFRAGASIGANIAEGRGRDTGKEYARYLRIARASANETDYWIHIARDCKLITDEAHERMTALTDECLRKLSSMITKLRAASERSVQEHSEPYISHEDTDL